jgi:N-acetyl-gamma-glutamyl-phosphate reductase
MPPTAPPEFPSPRLSCRWHGGFSRPSRPTRAEAAPRTAEGLLDAAVLKDQLTASFDQTYSDEPFVRVLPDGQWPQTAATTGSNVAQIQFTVDDRAEKILVVVALDNLVRGTAGQAIQSIHLALGLDETTALPLEGVAP